MGLLNFMADMTKSQRDVIVVQANCRCENINCDYRDVCSYGDSFTKCPTWGKHAERGLDKWN